MGELAATLDAFDQEFEKALHPLRADDSVRILPRATLELALAESNLPLTTSWTSSPLNSSRPKRGSRSKS